MTPAIRAAIREILHKVLMHHPIDRALDEIVEIIEKDKP